MYRGTVKLINYSGGYGIISEDNTYKDHVVLTNSLAQVVRVGDRVEFELVRGIKGYNCINVKVI